MVMLTGLAAPFDTPSVRPVGLGTFGEDLVEQFAPGCFDDSIGFAASLNVRAIFNHDYGAEIGSMRAGSLRLAVNGDGLVFELDLWGDLSRYAVAAQNRRLNGCSIGFHFRHFVIERVRGEKIRVVTKAALRHIALLAGEHWPAFSGTWIGIAQQSALPASRPVTPDHLLPPGIQIRRAQLELMEED